jgi:hypothetical protein
MRSSVLSPRDRRPVPVGRLAVRKTAARTGRRVSCSPRRPCRLREGRGHLCIYGLDSNTRAWRRAGLIRPRSHVPVTAHRVTALERQFTWSESVYFHFVLN